MVASFRLPSEFYVPMTVSRGCSLLLTVMDGPCAAFSGDSPAIKVLVSYVQQ